MNGTDREFDPARRGERLAAAKNRLERGEPVDLQELGLNPSIAESWMRCTRSGLRLEDAVSSDPKPRHAARGRHRELVAAAKTVLQALPEDGRDGSVGLALLDADGSILARMDGGDHVLERAFGNASKIDEETFGTVSAALALTTGRVEAVEAEEHYLDCLGGFSDAAAPVLDGSESRPAIAIMAVRADRGGERPAGARLKRLVRLLAQEVALRHQIVKANQKLELSRNLLANALSYVDDAIAIIDRDGAIVNMNKKAHDLLDDDRGGRLPRINDYLPHERRLASLILSGGTVNNYEARLVGASKRGPLHCRISTRPVTTRDGRVFQGCVLRISAEGSGAVKEHSSIASMTFDDLLGNDPVFLTAVERARVMAPTNVRIMLVGAVGTGKSAFAQAIHNARDPRAPFVAVNCAALSSELSERELLGYRGKYRSSPGKFEQANNGTLLLEEVGDLPLDLQALFVRILDDKCVTRIGDSEPTQTNFRLICTTKRDIRKLIDEGRFRDDLYYRICVLTIRIPPLADRPADIIPLANRFVSSFCASRNLPPISYAEEVRAAIKSYSWPGNIRQLHSSMKVACDLCRNGVIALEDLQEEVVGSERTRKSRAHYSLKETERQQIIEALQETGGNATQAAKLLGIGRSTLYKRIKRYGIEP